MSNKWDTYARRYQGCYKGLLFKTVKKLGPEQTGRAMEQNGEPRQCLEHIWNREFLCR